AAAALTPAAALGVEAAQFGVRPGHDEQTAKLQRAIDEAGRARTPLMLPAGVYRTGALRLPAGAQILGVRGATTLAFTRGNAMLAAEGGDSITLSGLTLDGARVALPKNRGLVHLAQVKAVRIVDCIVSNANGNGIVFEGCDGVVENNSIATTADTALFSTDGRGMTMRGNTIRGAGNGGIRVWQSKGRHDGSIVTGNTIEDIASAGGGTGENGNGVNVFRASGVIVSNNIIRRCAFSAVRGNAVSALQIVGNQCAAIAEVALYAEFGFEGAVISANTVDGAALGVVCTNFNEGGRLATVQGNIVRNLKPNRPQGGPDAAGVGVAVEADAAVTGNVIEDAPSAGISVGAGKYQRDVTVTGNVVRRAGRGIDVSIAAGAGHVAIAGNMIAEAKNGAIVGMEFDKVASDDLVRDAAKYPQLTISGNQVR
ncbi:MAG TPA: TIGR03808 family TAT-translocated repetitive protein, partial [Stellaceae bacterium]